MVSAAVSNPEVIRSLRSELKSLSSPSSSLEESEGEEKGKTGDSFSMSTCSMSTNPTPDNPLYAVTGVVGVNSNTEHQTDIGQSEASADAPDVGNVEVEVMTMITEKLAINDKDDDDDNDNTQIRSDPNLGDSNTEDSSSCLSSSVAVPATTGLHEAFDKSPEPVVKMKLRQNLETRASATQDAVASRYHMVNTIKEDGASVIKTSPDNHCENDDKKSRRNSVNLESDAIVTIPTTRSATMSSYEKKNIMESNFNSSATQISPLGTGNPVGASLLLRNKNSTTNDSFDKNPRETGFFTRGSSSFSDNQKSSTLFFVPQYICTKIAYAISKRVFDDANDDFAVATWLGFWAYLNVSCANFVLKPIMDAVVLQLGVENQATLIFASSVLAFLSSVPIGWLFEAPDPKRRKVFKKMGMTRGETQGTSLALFYRFFALSALSYAVGFQLVDIIQNYGVIEWIFGTKEDTSGNGGKDNEYERIAAGYIYAITGVVGTAWKIVPFMLKKWGQFLYIAFFLVIHLMKLHSTSLVWGVTTEAMEYEDIARKQHENNCNRRNNNNESSKPKKEKTRLQKLARIQFGGTLGGIWGSKLTSSLAEILHLPGLLVVSAILLEISAELSIELGRIMQKHWEEQQIFKSNQDLTSLDPSMKRSASSGSMKRVASGNSLYASQQAQQQQSMKRVASGNSVHSATRASNGSLTSMANLEQKLKEEGKQTVLSSDVIDDNTFSQRLLRGVTTILKSRLLMTIFTYNALFSSINTLLSFQRAKLVANRTEETTVSADTAFLANVNMASSIAMFAMQSSGAGALITQMFGTRGSLALMPLIRLAGLICLCSWHRSTNGQPPNLILFLMLDEFTRVINQAVAKPVRESLWSDLNNEARYEAKPIIDVLANRWGAGSASFCVYVVNHVLEFLGQTNLDSEHAQTPVVLGLPPVLFLGLIVSAWWVGVSLDLGQLRARIDLELKKHR